VGVNILEEVAGNLHDSFTPQVCIQSTGNHLPQRTNPPPPPPPQQQQQNLYLGCFAQPVISDFKFFCQQSVTKNKKESTD
jgi:hypothetical protein